MHFKLSKNVCIVTKLWLYRAEPKRKACQKRKRLILCMCKNMHTYTKKKMSGNQLKQGENLFKKLQTKILKFTLFLANI